MGFDAEREAAGLSGALRTLAPDPVDPAPIIRTALPFYGAGLQDMKRLAATWAREHPEAGPAEVLTLVDVLWQTWIREEMVTATMLLDRRPDARDRFGVRRYDRWARSLDNWETTDNLGGRVLGPWAAADPDDRLGVLERFAGRRNPWLRRLALVGCVYVGRREEAGRWFPRVTGIVLRLSDDREAAIPKAISWVLRSYTRHAAAAVAGFLDSHAADLPAIAVREARNKLQTGYKAGKPPPR
jgi:3-methyladenine DNA glycosylase AlkD